MLRLRKMEFRRNEFLGPRDPPALASIQTARAFTARGAAIAQGVIIIAPRNPVGIDKMIRCCCQRLLRRPDRLRTNATINSHIYADVLQQTLKSFTALAPELTYISKTDACSRQANP